MTHHWDDYLEKHGVRDEAIRALIAAGIDPHVGLAQLAAMTREQLAAIPGLDDADVGSVLEAVGPYRGE